MTIVTNFPNLHFRFKCVDLDGDGIITPNEMQYFYEEQLHRMECMAQERVLFEDIVCQMADMICPEVCCCCSTKYNLLLLCDASYKNV